MLTLDHALTLDEAAVQSPNLTDRFQDEDLKRIGEWVIAGYERDKASRISWENRTKTAMDLAMQIQTMKTFPWPDCSNVKFPLVTIAIMQFHARAYSAIIDGANVVKCRVIGDDPTSAKSLRAQRISSHMSWQVLEQDQDWEPQHDRLLINLATIGCAFKKSYYNGGERHNESDLVMAKDLVLDYWATSVGGCPRKTHVLPMFRNELYERCARKVFRDVREEPWFQSPAVVNQTTQQIESDKRQGVNPPSPADETTPYQVLEQHCWVDLDQDGYAEPYIITVEQTNKCVLRIVTRFDSVDDIEKDESGKVVAIKAKEFFTKYTFLPSPDGGIYDIGFGVLLGPLNESVNSLINQLIDIGTMSVTAGGFLGRGAKIRGGDYRFAPLEWKRVDSTGDDLNKSIVPLPVREPSAVLFQLLSLLVNYTERISGSTDMMVGENPGQNTPAQTSQAMLQEGMRIYNSIFKRIWWAMKEEFEKLYHLNAVHLPYEFSFGGRGGTVTRADYQGPSSDIVPVADPNITSESMRLQQAMTIKQSAMATPGYNPEEVEKFFLRALKVDGIDLIYPGIKKMPPGKSEKIQIEEMRLQADQLRFQGEQQQFAAELMEEQKLNEAKILEIKGKLMLEAQSVQTDQGDQQVNMMNAMVNMMEGRNKLIEGRLKGVMEQIKQRGEFIKRLMEQQTQEREHAVKHREMDIQEESLANDREQMAVDREQMKVDRQAIKKEGKEVNAK